MHGDTTNSRVLDELSDCWASLSQFKVSAHLSVETTSVFRTIFFNFPVFKFK